MPGKERDEESGQFTRGYADEDFVELVQQFDGLAGTTDVAEALGCTRRTAYTRLTELENDGRVNSQKVGNSLVWAVTDDTDAEQS